MSLFTLPVSVSDLTTLQSGLKFFISEATSEATAINTPGTAETVFTYAAGLLQNNFLLSQVAMAVDALMFGQTDNVLELTNLSTQFLPPQAANAVANGLNPTVYAAEALGLALAGGNGSSNNFATNFGSLSVSAFAQATANATGVNAGAIQQFVENWINFYTANPGATFGLSVTLASYGAAFGDAVGVALLNDTSAKLKTDIELNSDILLSGAVANALIDNAEGLYNVGVPLGSLPAHQLLQGEQSTTLNLVGAAGTVDMAQLPATINAINYRTPATGSVTIINQNRPLLVNLEDNTNQAHTLTVNGGAGLNDSLAISLGDTVHKIGDVMGAITVTGDELVTVFALGSNSTSIPVEDVTGLTTLTPTPGGIEQVTLGGDTVFACGPLADATNGVLNLNNMFITITNAQVTSLEDSHGGLLDFVTDAGANGGKFAPAISYSTNAARIDASASGGLVMLAGDANFDPVTGLGDVITGAAHPVSQIFNVANHIGDILVGSIGNDTLTSKSLTLPDSIYTDGGADTIILPAGHLGADHIGFYAADTRLTATAALLGSVAGCISEDSGGSEFVNPGWWGIGAGGSSTKIQFGGGLFGGATGTGTGADSSQLFGFVLNQDILDFSVRAWSGGLGLTADTKDGLVNVGAAGLASDVGSVAKASFLLKADLQDISGTGDDFIVIGGIYANASAVATALTNGSFTIFHSLLFGGDEADFLMAYQGQDGNAHIADLHLKGHATGILAGSFSTDHDESVYVSDIVTLVGVQAIYLSQGPNGPPTSLHLLT